MSVSALRVLPASSPFVPVPGASAGDANFQVLDIALVRLAPMMRQARLRPAYRLVGFAPADRQSLGQIYGRHAIPPAPPADGASVLVSFGEGETARPLLDEVLADRARPGLLHCADTRLVPGWAEMRGALTELGYQAVGGWHSAEIFVDAKALGLHDERPALATFDVFDTLIARRCIEPWRVFAQVGEAVGHPDFAAERQAAEQRVVARRYVFDDIYDELARHYGWSEARRREVQEAELACELANVVPIAENLRQVRHGDLLVSDMYLSEAHIRGLLAKAGLEAEVGLVVESHGKSSGRVWDAIGRAFNVTRHLGDNPQADAEMPRRLGLTCEITRVSDPNVTERALVEVGLRGLAEISRRVRLATWHDKRPLRDLQVLQASLNLPMLALASVLLARRAAALGATSLLFCSRDTNLWQQLFDAMQPGLGGTLPTAYFLTSRVAQRTGSDGYLAYARRLLTPGALVVDLCGTGGSMTALARRLGREPVDLFLLDHCAPDYLFSRTPHDPALCRIHTAFATRPQADNIVLELGNMAEHAMVVDMRAAGDAFVPVFRAQAFSEAAQEAVTVQRAAFLTALDDMRGYDCRELTRLDDASLQRLCASLYETYSRFGFNYKLFETDFFAEDNAVVSALTGSTVTRRAI